MAEALHFHTGGGQARGSDGAGERGVSRRQIKAPHLLVFQMCSVSGSVMPRLSACSSRKSKKYLTASGGRSGGMLRMA